MNQILCIALALLVGLLSTRLMKLLRLPNVTGFLIAGIIFGPYCLGQFIGGWGYGDNTVEAISWISDIALGFIALTIGISFRLDAIKKVGKQVVVITIFEALGGTILVIGALFIAYIFLGDESLPIGVILTLGAIACATAPAATLMIVKQYNARGPVVNTLLPVVAFDDAVALIAFSVLFAIGKSLILGDNISVIEILVVPLIEIVSSLAIGAVLGVLISLGFKLFKSRNNRMIMCITSVLVVVGLTALATTMDWQILGVSFTFSSLLACMMTGAMIVNLRKDSVLTFEQIDRWTSPLYMLFFVISGASLNLSIFLSEGAWVVIIIALTYVIFRALGKWLGAFVSSKITKADKNVQKYLGFTLFPQAGVAIGLATTANQIFSTNELTAFAGELILTVTLMGTIIYELLGPVITKIALTKAGEITKEKKTQPPVSSSEQ